MERTIRDFSHMVDKLNDSFAELDLAQRLVLIGELAEHAVFTTSLGMEDQIITWGIANSAQNIEVATLQTGRLFPETLDLIQQTRERFRIDIKEYKPNPANLQKYIDKFGKDGFYDSIQARKACCFVRKLEPLAKALEGADVWVTGLRRGQSQDRSSIDFVEWDAERGLLKVNPLADWSSGDVKETIAIHDIPVNPLHAKGFPSIGCAPCTRAIQPSEDERAGRWWWEQQNTRECGLHVASDEASIDAETKVQGNA